MNSLTPYPGLRPFQRDETDIFFGREEQTDQLLDKLAQSRFLAVVGPSGCGKSSLVRAGLIGALETGFMAQAGARWSVAEMRPGDHPMRRLTESVISVLGRGRNGGEDAEAFLFSTLRRGPLGLIEALHETPLPERTNLLLLVDQFEEIFRYRREGDRDEADAFVALLLESAMHSEVALYVVITMRSDFLGKSPVFAGLPEALNESTYLTPRLTREQRCAAIAAPAKVFGSDVEPALVNRLLNDMGADSDQLPLLQHALMRMWNLANPGFTSGPEAKKAEKEEIPPTVRTLALADYEAVGGLTEALSRHADEAFDELSPEGRRIAEMLFRCLSEGDTRRPMAVADVAAVAGVSLKQIVEVVEVFRRPDRSFLTPRAGEPLRPDSILDISHESLIRQWRRLNEWVRREQRSAETYRLLEQTARLWKHGEAALWGTPNLENALTWRQREKPTTAWAERYGGNLDLAVEFLDASIARWQAQEVEAAAAHERELKQARSLAEEQSRRAEAESRRAEDQLRANQRLTRLAAALAIALVLAAIVTVLAWNNRQLAAARAQDAVAAEKKAKAASAEALRAERRAEAASLQSTADAQRARAMESMANQEKDFANEALKKAKAEKRRALLSAQQASAAETQAKLAQATAEHVETTSQAHDLARDATLNLEEDPELSVLLAMQAVSATTRTTPEAEQALHHAVQASRIRMRLRSHQAMVTGIVISPDSSQMASAGADGIVRVKTRASGRELTVQGPRGAVYAASFSPNQKYIFTGDLTGRITLWSASHGERLGSVTAHEGAVLGASFSPDGRRLATCSTDRTAKLWEVTFDQRDIPSFKEAMTLRGHTDAVRALAFSPDGRRLATCGHDGKVIFWDTRAGRRLSTYQGDLGKIYDLAFSQDGARLAIAGAEGKARILDSSSGQQLAAVDASDAIVGGVAFSPDGKRLATAGSALKLWNIEGAAASPSLVKTWDEGVLSVAFSPDGTRLAASSATGAIKIWDAATYRELVSVPDLGLPAWNVVFSLDGRHLLSAGLNGLAQVWDSASGRELFSMLGNPPAISGLSFSGDGSRLAVLNPEAIEVTDLRSQRRLLSLSGPRLKNWGSWLRTAAFSSDGTRLHTLSSDGVGQTFQIDSGERVDLFSTGSDQHVAAFSSGGERLAIAGKDQRVRIWEVASHKKIQELRDVEDETNRINALSFALGSDLLAIAYSGGRVRVFEVATGKGLPPLLGHTNGVVAVAFSRDSKGIATVSFDTTAKVWEVDSGKEILSLKSDTDWMTAVSFDAGGSELVTGDKSGWIKRWDLSPAHELTALVAHAGCIRRLAFSPDGKRLATAGGDGTVRVWKSSTLEMEYSIENHRVGFWDVRFSPDGTRLATASEDGAVGLWDAESGRPLQAPMQQGKPARAVAFSQDGRLLASAGKNESTIVWDLASVRKVHVLADNSDVNAAEFSPDGKLIATGNDLGEVRILDAASGEELHFLVAHRGRVNRVVFSADGTFIATASDDRTAKLWKVASGELVRTFSGHSDTVKSVAFSPDQRRIVTASFDRTAKVWNVESGEELDTLSGYKSQVRDVSYTPDGRSIVTSGEDGTVRMYATAIEDLMKLARERVTRRGLTPSECERYFHSKQCPAAFREEVTPTPATPPSP